MQIKKRPSILKYQSNISCCNAKLHIDKNEHLTSLKAVQIGVVGEFTSCFEPMDKRTCFACDSEFSEKVEIRQRSVFIDVS